MNGTNPYNIGGTVRNGSLPPFKTSKRVPQSLNISFNNSPRDLSPVDPEKPERDWSPNHRTEFRRASPKPTELESSFRQTLPTNKYDTYLRGKDNEDYKVKVFDNFKDISRAMTGAYLRLAQIKKKYNVVNKESLPDAERI